MNFIYAHILDSAFVDRADIIQYVDLPPRDAIYEILRSCLSELVAKGVIGQIVGLICFEIAALAHRHSQDVPSLTQAILYERTATFPSVNGPSPPVPPTFPSASGQSSSASSAPATTSTEQREKSKNVGLRLLGLAEKCRVTIDL